MANQNPHKMQLRFGRLLALLFELLFSPIHYPEDRLAQLKALCDQGVLVYVIRGPSLWLTTCYNYLFIRAGLPIPQYIAGVSFFWLQPLSHVLAWFWKKLRRQHLVITETWKTRHQLTLRPKETLLADCVWHEHPAFIALPHGRFYKAAVQWHDTNDYLRALLTAQKHMQKSIFIVPHVLVAREQSGPSGHTWFDKIFGDRRYPGALRRFFMLWSLRQGTIRLGAPIDLKKLLEENPDIDETSLARKLRGDLQHVMNEEERVIAGPPISAYEETARRVLKNALLRQTIAEENHLTGQSDIFLENKAAQHLRSIAAHYDVTWIKPMSRLLDIFFYQIYDGIAVDADGLQEAIEASRKGPVIFCPSHRSHLDYLVLSYVLWQNGIAPPHIAAGNNLSFFPLGTIFRHCGAFFMQRTFKQKPLYAAVFRAYLFDLIKQGVAIEFFLEGTRSRSGKLLPPKLGLLSMIVHAWRYQYREDIQFVPISIDYERIIEATSYLQELKGKDKKDEDLSGLLQSSRILGSRYGRVQVQFGDPVSLASWAKEQGLPQSEAASWDESWKKGTEKLAYTIMHGIASSTSVTANELAAITLLGHTARAMPQAIYLERSKYLLTFLKILGARLSHALGPHETLNEILIQAVQKFVRDKLVTLESVGGSDQEPIYKISEDSRIQMDFYKNAVMNYLAPAAIVARIFQAEDYKALSITELQKQSCFLGQLFKKEFMYAPALDYDKQCQTSIDHLIQIAALSSYCPINDPTIYVQIEDRQMIQHLASLIDNFVQAYLCTLESIEAMIEQGSYTEKSFLDKINERLKRSFLEGKIISEAVSKSLIKNALHWAMDAGVIELVKENNSRKNPFLRIGNAYNPQRLAERIKNLTFYNNRSFKKSGISSSV